MPLEIRKFLQGKGIFLTGGTGFLGKVLIEKVLRSIPDVGSLFCLIRPSHGISAEERLQKEVLESPCFNRLREERSDFEEYVRAKLVVIPGELTQHNAGISDEHLEEIYSRCQVFIHCAATIDFNTRIDLAIELNVLGTLRIFEIAQKCQTMEAFIHISTCYVNCHMEGLIHERLYPLPFKPEEILEKVAGMNVNELGTLPAISELLGEYPNTYTFTKSMAEHMLVSRRGSTPLAICRPSIVGAAHKEPCPGWTDVISAAGAVFVAAGLGVLKLLPGSEDFVADVVPVDFVINSIICAIPDIANSNTFMVYHSATSTIRPTTWGLAVESVVPYFRRNPSSRAVGPCQFRLIGNPQLFQLAFFLQYSIPAALLNSIALIGTSKQKLLAANFERLLFRVRVITESFRHFVEHYWLFDATNTVALRHNLSEEESKIFSLDLSDLDWAHYNENFSYGLMKFVLKENIIDIDYKTADDIYMPIANSYRENRSRGTLVNRLFPDAEWAIQTMKTHPKSPVSRPLETLHDDVLLHEKVQEVIMQTASEKNDTISNVENEAREIIARLAGETDHRVMVGFGWLLKKIFGRLYDVISVNRGGIKKVVEAMKKGPIILLPTHRSYVDFLVCSFICFAWKLPLPYIAAGEDFLGILGVRWLFRKSGAFFIRRSFSGDKLYQTIVDVYLATLLGDHHCIEFFIEGTRSRSGKMLHPKTGLLKTVTDVHFDGQLDDIMLVPLTINYEKTIEEGLYSNELLGDSKIKESLRNLLGSASVLSLNFGRIATRLCDPISLKDYTASYTEIKNHASPNEVFDPYQNKSHREELNTAAAYKIVFDMSMATECMGTHVVASLLLMYRQGISKIQLMEKVDWLRQQLKARGAPVSFLEGQRRDLLVEKSLAHLRSFIIERRRQLYEPLISEREDFKNMLALGHYKNKIVHWFFREGLWACALYQFGEQMQQGVPLNQLLGEVEFLYSLLNSEFIFKPDPNQPEDFCSSLRSMVESGILIRTEDDRVKMAPTGEAHFSFLCAMFWPFIDSYYVTALTLVALQPDKIIEENELVKRSQWLGTTLYADSMLSFFEACSMDTLKNAFETLAKWGVIKRFREPGSTIKSVQLIGDYQKDEKLQELVSRIDRFRKQPPVKQSLSRMKMVAENPILAKL